MTKKYRFSLATQYLGSETWEKITLQFDDDETEDEIERQVNEVYNEWIGNKNYGGWHEVD